MYMVFVRNDFKNEKEFKLVEGMMGEKNFKFDILGNLKEIDEVV